MLILYLTCSDIAMDIIHTACMIESLYAPNKLKTTGLNWSMSLVNCQRRKADPNIESNVSESLLVRACSGETSGN